MVVLPNPNVEARSYVDRALRDEIPVLVETQDVTNLRRTIGQVRALGEWQGPRGWEHKGRAGPRMWALCLRSRRRLRSRSPVPRFCRPVNPRSLTVVCAPAAQLC